MSGIYRMVNPNPLGPYTRKYIMLRKDFSLIEPWLRQMLPMVAANTKAGRETAEFLLSNGDDPADDDDADDEEVIKQKKQAMNIIMQYIDQPLLRTLESYSVWTNGTKVANMVSGCIKKMLWHVIKHETKDIQEQLLTKSHKMIIYNNESFEDFRLRVEDVYEGLEITGIKLSEINKCSTFLNGLPDELKYKVKDDANYSEWDLTETVNQTSWKAKNMYEYKKSQEKEPGGKGKRFGSSEKFGKQKQQKQEEKLQDVLAAQLAKEPGWKKKQRDARPKRPAEQVAKGPKGPKCFLCGGVGHKQDVCGNKKVKLDKDNNKKPSA